MTKRANRRTTLQEVAERAGVHQSTASRALDPRTRHLITEDVVAKVERAVEQLNYRHNRVAAGLRTNRTRAIGIIVPDITNMLFPPIIRGVENRIAEDGFVAMIAHTDGDPAKERSMIETFLSHGSDGLVVASVRLEDQAIAAAAREGAAVVTVNRRLAGDTVSSVTHDETAGIGAVLEHLTDLGHKDFAFLSGPTSSSTGRSRLVAYRQWARRLGIKTPEGSVAKAQAFMEEEGRRRADDLLAAGARFTALVCASDILAVGAIATLRKWGVGCPADVSVTGFNDIPFVDRISPSLTTVHGEHYKLGWTAAEMLLEDLAAPARKRQVRHAVLPVTFVARESSAPAPDANARSRRAPA
jgi:LacI family transcriptional regulator, galactose operon repressor